MAGPRHWVSRPVMVVGLAAALAIGVTATPAVARDGWDADTRVASWDEAAATLGTAGSLWEPRWTADLERSRWIGVLADGLAFAGGRVSAGDTAAVTRYGGGTQALWVEQKWADTGWAVEPASRASRGLVARVPVRLGQPGQRITVQALVYAECAPQRSRCEPRDVVDGGLLVMTARPASTMTAPGDTSVRLRSVGLTYRQLVRVARSLQQVAGAPLVAGSAQMVAMCRQMSDAAMDLSTATAFAQSLGYTVRVGSIDGELLAVTTDYRPDRFTVAVVGGPEGTVTGCTYG